MFDWSVFEITGIHIGEVSDRQKLSAIFAFIVDDEFVFACFVSEADGHFGLAHESLKIDFVDRFQRTVCDGGRGLFDEFDRASWEEVHLHHWARVREDDWFFPSLNFCVAIHAVGSLPIREDNGSSSEFAIMEEVDRHVGVAD